MRGIRSSTLEFPRIYFSSETETSTHPLRFGGCWLAAMTTQLEWGLLEEGDGDEDDKTTWNISRLGKRDKLLLFTVVVAPTAKNMHIHYGNRY